MSDPPHPALDDARVVIRDDDGAAYAIPVREMERYRMTAERRAVVAAHLIEQGSTVEAPIYEVDPCVFAPYRLSQEAWTRLEAALHERRSDVHGFGIQGRLPDWVALVVSTPGGVTERSYIHTLPSWYWFDSGGGGDARGEDPRLW